MWSSTVAPLRFNSKIGLMECGLIGPNTLILFSSFLWKVFSPQNGIEMINSKNLNKYVFPKEDSFDFFSFENVLLSSTVYKEAKDIFEKGGLSGFFPPQTLTNETIKCVSDTLNFEKYLRSDDQSPIFLCFINSKSEVPFEIGKFAALDPFLQFNYLDLTDKTNVLFTKYVYNEILKFVQQSSVVQTYFGTLEVKRGKGLNPESSLITPLVVEAKEGILPQLDIFLKFPSVNFFLYFSPHMDLVQNDGWVSVHEFFKLYAATGVKNKKELTLFPNTAPYPDSSSHFSKPFFLFSLNFGKFNYLNGQRGALSGETSNARCLLCMLNYSAQTGICI